MYFNKKKKKVKFINIVIHHVACFVNSVLRERKKKRSFMRVLNKSTRQFDNEMKRFWGGKNFLGDLLEQRKKEQTK